MRIIKPARVREFARRHPASLSALMHWLSVADRAQWQSLVHVRNHFPSADEVKVGSGKTVVVFNIKGNAFRLITAIHYNRGKLFIMMFLTHAEYSKNAWKVVL